MHAIKKSARGSLLFRHSVNAHLLVCLDIKKCMCFLDVFLGMVPTCPHLLLLFKKLIKNHHIHISYQSSWRWIMKIFHPHLQPCTTLDKPRLQDIGHNVVTVLPSFNQLLHLTTEGQPDWDNLDSLLNTGWNCVTYRKIVTNLGTNQDQTAEKYIKIYNKTRLLLKT